MHDFEHEVLGQHSRFAEFCSLDRQSELNYRSGSNPVPIALVVYLSTELFADENRVMQLMRDDYGKSWVIRTRRKQVVTTLSRGNVKKKKKTTRRKRKR